MVRTLLVVCILGGSVVLLAEFLRHGRLIKSETSRKMIHMAHCFVVAGWPFFLPYRFIFLAELLFVAVVLTAQHINLFKPLWLINRKSWGELFLPFGVITMCLFRPPAWVFAVALLHAGVADALAALLGKRIKSQAYTIWGQKKSVAGTLVFAFSSLVILVVAFQYLTPAYSAKQFHYSLLSIVSLTTLMENFSPYGTDNVFVPLTVLGLLRIVGLA